MQGSADKIQVTLSLVDNLSKEMQRTFDKVGRDIKDFEKKIGQAKFNLMPDEVINKNLSGFGKLRTKLSSGLHKLRQDFNQPITFTDITHTALSSVPFMGMVKAVKTAKEFQDDVAGIMMTIPHAEMEAAGGVAKYRKAIESEIIHMSQSIGKSIPDISHGFKTIVQGLSDLPIDERLNQASKIGMLVEKVAQTYKAPAEMVAGTVMAIRANSPEIAKDLTKLDRLMNRMAIVTHDTGATLQDQAEAMREYDTAVNGASVSEEKFLAITGRLLQKRGVGSGARVAEVNKELFGFIGSVKGGSMKKQQVQALAALGFTPQEATKLARESADKFVDELMMRLGKIDGNKQIAISRGLFGEHFYSRILGLAKSYNDAALGVTKLTQELNNQNRVMKELNQAYEESKTFAQKIQILKNAVYSLGVAYGAFLLPGLESVTDQFAGFVFGLGSFLKEHPNVVAAITGIVTTLTALKVGTMALKFAWRALFIEEIIVMIANIGKLIAALKVACAFMFANPIGLALLGTAAVGGAGYLGYKMFKDLTKNPDSGQQTNSPEIQNKALEFLGVKTPDFSANISKPDPKMTKFNGTLTLNINNGKEKRQVDMDLSQGMDNLTLQLGM